MSQSNGNGHHTGELVWRELGKSNGAEKHADHEYQAIHTEVDKVVVDASEKSLFDIFHLDPVDEYLTTLAQTLALISREDIWAVVRVLFQAWQEGRRVFIIGNGGSAATASHMATDLSKQTIVPGKPRMKVLSLTDNVALMSAWANDTDYENIFAEQLRCHIQSGDTVIAISASGNSRNVLRGIELASEFSAITVGFTGRDGGRLKEMVDYCVTIPDDYIGRQEDGHMILDHVIAATLRRLIENSPI